MDQDQDQCGFHQLTGTAVPELDRSVALLRDAGHGSWADRVEAEVLGRSVIPGHSTFQIVEAYNSTSYEPFRDLERHALRAPAGGRDHLYEAVMKDARRTTPLALPEGCGRGPPRGATRARHQYRTEADLP
ncbi:hypothetical protein ACFV0D_01075 [Streptomyces sp. NPDC059556]|uniref:hypothetical protein n=1 Tax=Streptomyces sp. NPDC059556 TaxID=3346863 RepID=UPI0036B74530